MKTKKLYRMPLQSYFLRMMIIMLGVNALCSMLAFWAIMEWGFKGQYRLSNCLLALGGILACLTLWMAANMYYGAGYLVRPLQSLTQALSRVGQGDFEVVVPRKASLRKDAIYVNELDHVTQTFNGMVSQLRHLSLMRTDFMRNVSHEYRTPLGNMMNLMELVEEDSGLSSQSRTYLAWSKEECSRLANLGESLLVLSALQQGGQGPAPKTFRLDEVARQVAIRLQDKLAKEGHDLVLELAPLEVLSIEDYWRQILMNLVDNAIKYSPASSEIYVGLTRDQDQVTLTVVDQGIGIAAEKQEDIFEPFYQVDESHGQSGYGIGLALVAKMAQVVGAQVTCQSKLGQGTTMLVTLPLESEE